MQDRRMLKEMKARKAMKAALQAMKAAMTAFQEIDDEGAEGDEGCDEGRAEGDEEPAMQEANEAVVVDWVAGVGVVAEVKK